MQNSQHTMSYETVIGLEVHVQLATQSKAFCSDDTSFGAQPNTQTSTISLAHPGTLPQLNENQLLFAVKMGLALGCSVAPVHYFDRKNYFYPDLPKGYQITQDAHPICLGGSLPIYLDGQWKPVRIHHIHMEEDAGKSIHDQHPTRSFVDLNRAGMPLLEIVTHPDLRSPEEVDAFMSGIRQLVRYLGISDGNMQEGSLRCDCNISVRKLGDPVLGQRCEVKNLNSMRYARKAIEYEVDRQIALLEQGLDVIQETRSFDPVSGTTASLRSKEDAPDYRYFPEPDLPPLVTDFTWLENIKRALPALPWEVYHQFKVSLGLQDAQAFLLSEDPELAAYFLNLAKSTALPISAANLVIQKIRPFILETGMAYENFPIPNSKISALLNLVESNALSASVAYERIFPALLQQPEADPLQLAKSLDLLQVSDAGEFEKIAEQLLHDFPEKVRAFQSGKKGLLGFFMGEFMKATKGKANPKMASDILSKLLEKK